MQTEYRPIDNFPGYRVGNDGSVWCCRLRGMHGGKFGEWRQMKSASKNKYGHQIVRLFRDGKAKCFGVHRLVLITFRGDPAEGQECRHLDGNPRNNRLGNLAWGTPKENTADSIHHETHPSTKRLPWTVLTEVEVREIRKAFSNGESPPSLARKYKISRDNVYSITKRRTWAWLEDE